MGNIKKIVCLVFKNDDINLTEPCQQKKQYRSTTQKRTSNLADDFLNIKGTLQPSQLSSKYKSPSPDLAGGSRVTKKAFISERLYRIIRQRIEFILWSVQ